MKDSGSTKQSSRRLSKEDIKKRLMHSLVNYENINTDGLNEQVNIVESYEEAIDIIKEDGGTIKANKKTIYFSYQHGKGFKNFKENRNFKRLVE